MMPLTQMSSSSSYSPNHQNRPLLQCFITNQAALKVFFKRAVGDTADADDLFQKLLMKALKIEHTSHIDNFLAYGYRMAHHLVVDHHREQNKSPESLEHEPPSDTLSLESALEHEQRLQLYQRVIAEMSPLRRDIFIRRRLHEQSRTQIADSLGMSEEAVKKHISRAMEMLKVAMTEYLSTYDCPL